MGRWEADVGFGSWLCENAKTLNRDRRSYSSRTVLVAQRASGFNLEIELKNIILCGVSVFEFLHSQGQSSALLRFSWIATGDFVGLKIAQGGAQDRRRYACPRRARHQIADRVLALVGRPSSMSISIDGP